MMMMMMIVNMYSSNGGSVEHLRALLFSAGKQPIFFFHFSSTFLVI